MTRLDSFPRETHSSHTTSFQLDVVTIQFLVYDIEFLVYKVLYNVHKQTNSTSHMQTNKADDSIPTGLSMDKQQSNTDNNTRITAIIIIESNTIVVLFVCDLIALRGGG